LPGRVVTGNAFRTSFNPHNCQYRIGDSTFRDDANHIIDARTRRPAKHDRRSGAVAFQARKRHAEQILVATEPRRCARCNARIMMSE
jgi:hypothetical protein